MLDNLLQSVISEFKHQASNTLLVENNDGFLFREDVIEVLKESGVVITKGNAINQRVSFELRDKNEILVLVNKNRTSYLEDIEIASVRMEFFLKAFISGYHIPSIVDQTISTLESLHSTKQLFSLSKLDTKKEIERILETQNEKTSKFDFKRFSNSIEKELNKETKDWKKLAQLTSKAILETIDTSLFEDVMDSVNSVNEHFQKGLEKEYKQLKNSSAVKKPKIVSKVLDYIDFNFKEDKVALIVIDGMSMWQYQLLSKFLPGTKKEEVIYSWIPSITQLSRQAIFRGDSPIIDYRQGPTNESKLWRQYWLSKGFNPLEISYNHEQKELPNLTNIKRLAIVYKKLDDNMHSSEDFNDLLDLTENWISRTQINRVVSELLKNGFKIFITTDHGNIQAKGWRGLQGKEKLGTNKSGSRSERHLEYSEKWLLDDFIKNNSELLDSVVLEEQAVYFKDDLSFSRRDNLVTHGGAHFLEVLIPFIELSNE